MLCGYRASTSISRLFSTKSLVCVKFDCVIRLVINKRYFNESVKLCKQFETHSSLDSDDVSRFEQLATQWSDENGSFKPLHSFNKVRIPWIVAALSKKNTPTDKPLNGLRVLDVGCGGGILSIPLIRLGANVDGIDASPEAIKSAELVSKKTLPEDLQNNLKFHCATVEDYVKEHAETYNAVIASEIIEHVTNPEIFVDYCVRACNNNGLLFFTTINKTTISNLLAIGLAENILKIVPPGIHEWDKFIPPEELRKMLTDRNCKIRSTQGLFYNPFSNNWSWISWKDVNYALYAIKY